MQQDLGTEKPETRREFRARRDGSGRSPGSSLIVAVLLITAGALLFLDNIGLLRVNVWDYWPVILIVVGVSKLARGRYTREHLWGVFLVVLGALFLLATLDIVRVHSWDSGWPISLLLIAVGFMALIKTVENNQVSRRRTGFPQQPIAGGANPLGAHPLGGNTLNEHAVFGSVQRRFDNAVFEGGQLQSVFGSVEVDLRGARNDSTKSPVTVHVECVFGSVKIRMPQTWRVEVRVEGVFGSFEDKTIPATTPPGFQSVLLILSGSYIFGSVEVDN